MTHRIEPRQEYVTCDPRDNIRIRITGWPVTMNGLHSYGKVQIVTIAADGGETRSRAIAVSSLHPTGLTRDGKPRKTGYRLVRNADGSPVGGEA